MVSPQLDPMSNEPRDRSSENVTGPNPKRNQIAVRHRERPITIEAITTRTDLLRPEPFGDRCEAGVAYGTRGALDRADLGVVGSGMPPARCGPDV